MSSAPAASECYKEGEREEGKPEPLQQLRPEEENNFVLVGLKSPSVGPIIHEHVVGKAPNEGEGGGGLPRRPPGVEGLAEDKGLVFLTSYILFHAQGRALRLGVW